MSTARPANHFTFLGYQVRPVAEQDRAYLDLLIQGDEYHRGRMSADFFLKLQPGEDAWALEDQQGEVVFYFKTQTAVRLAIQFTDSSTLAAKRRNSAALIDGLAWLTGILRQNRFHEMLFDTQGPELYVFAKRHLGFVDAPGLLSLALTSSQSMQMQPEALGNVPTDGLERVG